MSEVTTINVKRRGLAVDQIQYKCASLTSYCSKKFSSTGQNLHVKKVNH